jgi:hypothetical protein
MVRQLPVRFDPELFFNDLHFNHALIFKVTTLLAVFMNESVLFSKCQEMSGNSEGLCPNLSGKNETD